MNAEKELLSPPGDDILETIEHIKMSRMKLAGHLGVSAYKVQKMIAGKEPITNNTALQLEKVLGIDAQFWINRENNYRRKLDLLAQQKELEEKKMNK